MTERPIPMTMPCECCEPLFEATLVVMRNILAAARDVVNCRVPQGGQSLRLIDKLEAALGAFDAYANGAPERVVQIGWIGNEEPWEEGPTNPKYTRRDERKRWALALRCRAARLEGEDANGTGPGEDKALSLVWWDVADALDNDNIKALDDIARRRRIYAEERERTSSPETAKPELRCTGRRCIEDCGAMLEIDPDCEKHGYIPRNRESPPRDPVLDAVERAPLGPPESDGERGSVLAAMAEAVGNLPSGLLASAVSPNASPSDACAVRFPCIKRAAHDGPCIPDTGASHDASSAEPDFENWARMAVFMAHGDQVATALEDGATAMADYLREQWREWHRTSQAGEKP